jgi:mRNA-degrading endonuclease toxin of MazEF toxin-antitoxin module
LIRRGCIYFANLPGVGRKRVLVVSWNAVNAGMWPVVVRVTSRWRERNIPTYVELEAGEANLPETSWALCHELFTIPANLFDDEPEGELSFGRMMQIGDALKRALDL